MAHYQPLKQTIGIPYYSNLQCNTLGLDSSDHCFDKNHYNLCGDVNYSFDDMGYRNNTPYQHNAILAIGDSFTLGLGVNVDDTWANRLSKILNYPVLNFSLNGASNDWIARRTTELMDFFKPKAVIVHYTFSHRRERPQQDWHDDERTECEPLYTEQENYENWRANFTRLSKLKIPIVHSFITNWHTSSINYAALGTNIIAPQPIYDLARDGFHYGPKTHQILAEKITNLLDFELHQFL